MNINQFSPDFYSEYPNYNSYMNYNTNFEENLPPNSATPASNCFEKYYWQFPSAVYQQTHVPPALTRSTYLLYQYPKITTFNNNSLQSNLDATQMNNILTDNPAPSPPNSDHSSNTSFRSTYVHQSPTKFIDNLGQSNTDRYRINHLKINNANKGLQKSKLPEDFNEYNNKMNNIYTYEEFYQKSESSSSNYSNFCDNEPVTLKGNFDRINSSSYATLNSIPFSEMAATSKYNHEFQSQNQNYSHSQNSFLNPIEMPLEDLSEETMSQEEIPTSSDKVIRKKKSSDKIIKRNKSSDKIKKRNKSSNKFIKLKALTSEGKFKCSYCNRYFSQECYLKQHIKAAHLNPKCFKCTKCGKYFLTEARLNIHKEKHDSNDKKFKCNECSKQFHYRADLKRHCTLHSDTLPHICDVCNKGFSRRDHLLKHKDTHVAKWLRVSNPNQI